MPDMRWRTADTDQPRPGLEFPSLGDFVHGFLVYAYARQVTDTHERVWCPQWWKHPEALHRLHTLWRTYKELHATGPLGVSAWWCDHADLHMPKLFDPDGCFKFCSVRIGHKDLLQPLPVDEPPAELFSTLMPPVAARRQRKAGTVRNSRLPRSSWNQNLSVRI